jgi:hypothetical protein
VFSVDLRAPRFICPACRGTECTYAGASGRIEWDFPCTCDRCGARSRLTGFPRYLAATVVLIGAVFAFYFNVFAHYWTVSPVLALLGMAAAVYAAMWMHDRVVNGLAAWELASAAPPAPAREDERGLETPLGVALRRNWIYLAGAPLFGPFQFLLAPRYGIPPSVSSLLFFAVLLPTLWPIVTGRAPLTFWIVAVALWMAGFVVGIMLDSMKLVPG